MPTAFLNTKMYWAHEKPNLVARPRLLEKLDRGLDGDQSLILLSAPAGYGKTTLLHEWLSAKAEGYPSRDSVHPSSVILPPWRVAWLTLDEMDNDPNRFWAYVILSLQAIRDELGETALAQLRSPQPPPIQEIFPSLLAEMDSFQDHGILVLDDYHLITSAVIHGSLTHFLENLPPNLHLVVSARSDPPLPIAKLRARGQVIELRADELRFTPDEAAAFLNQAMPVALSPGQAAALGERTEGWVAGLQMAALSMQGRDAEHVDGFIRAFAGTHRFIMDYLLEEVLAREPEPVQSFLLQTSILRRLTGPLCDMVVGSPGGQEMLEQLEKSNLFVVPLDDNRRWYRYHHLFADLLQARLHESGSDHVAQLCSRAAEWCEREGYIADAVGYALEAKDYAWAAGLIARHWSAKTGEGEIETVWSWVNALPESVVRNSAAVSVVYCWLLWLKGEVRLIEPHLVDAERAAALEKLSTEAEGNVSMPAELAALRSFVARHGNDHEAAVAHAERALQVAPRDLPPLISGQLHTALFVALASAYEGAGDLAKAAGAYAETIRLGRIGRTATGIAVVFLLGRVLWILGRLRETEAACRDALEYIEEQGMSRLPAAGILHVALAEVLIERNDLQAAEDRLSRGMELGRRTGRLNAVHNAAHARMRLCLARQDMRGAMAAIQEAISALGETKRPLWGELFALKATILVRQECLTEALETIEEAERLVGDDHGVTGQTVALAAHRVRLAQSKSDEAIARLTRSLVTAEKSGRLGAATEMHILRSLALARLGDAQKAEADLERALALAEPEAYLRLFLDEGQPMQLLLTQWLAQAGAGRIRDYAFRVLSQFDSEPHAVRKPGARAGDPSANLRLRSRPGSRSALVEPLTPREIQVLRLIYAGDSNRAIADKLVITTSAVKKHTGNILGKLGATNRVQAIVKARQLGLFPEDQ